MLDLNSLNVDASPFPLQFFKLALQFAFCREVLALLDCLAALAPLLFIFVKVVFLLAVELATEVVSKKAFFAQNCEGL